MPILCKVAHYTSTTRVEVKCELEELLSSLRDFDPATARSSQLAAGFKTYGCN